jgi:hypothetical protein
LFNCGDGLRSGVMMIVDESNKKKPMTKSMIVARGITALLGLLWLFLGFNEPTADQRAPSLLCGVFFLVSSFFPGRLLIATCYFLFGFGLVLSAAKGGRGHLLFGFVGLFSVAVSLFLYRGWFLPLVRTPRLRAEGASKSEEKSEGIDAEVGQFPDLVNLSSSELEAVVSTDRARYAESYVQAAERVLKLRSSGLSIQGTNVVRADSGRRLPKLEEVDGRLLLLAAGFLVFTKSLEIILNVVSRVPLSEVAYYALLVDVVLAIKLLERKSWARGCLIVLCLFGVVSRAGGFYSEGNIIGAVDIFLSIFTLLALIGVRTTFRRGLVYVCGYLLWAISVLSYAVYAQYSAKSAVASMESPNVFKSAKGYQLSLEGSGWKVVPSGDAGKMIPNLSPNVDAVLAKGDAKGFGTLTPEDLGTIKVNDESLGKITAFLEKTYFSSAISKTEIKIPSGRVMSGVVRVQGQDLAMIGFWKAYKTIAMNGLFWSAAQDMPDLRRDVGALIDRITEVPLRDRLSQHRPSEIFSRNSDSVVLIRTYNEEGEIISYGSGFNLKKDGLVMTNLHVVVGGGSYLDVKFPSGKVFDGVSIVAVGKDRTDLALLKFNGKDLPFVQELGRVDVEVGDPVYVISNPEGLINSLSEGIVSAIRPNSGSTLYQITAAISDGSSGGAVFDQFGQVVGVATSRIKGAESLNFATPIMGLENLSALPNALSLKELIALLDNASKDKNDGP